MKKQKPASRSASARISGTKVVVTVFRDEQAMRAGVEPGHRARFKVLRRATAYCYLGGDRSVQVRLHLRCDQATAAHECVHAAMFVLRRQGVPAVPTMAKRVGARSMELNQRLAYATEKIIRLARRVATFPEPV